MKLNVILPCGGSGSRTRLGYNKLLYDIGGGMRVIEKTLNCFDRRDVSRIIIAISDTDKAYFEQLAGTTHLPVTLCQGGKTRTESVRNALACVEEDCDYVLVHDGARPFLRGEILDEAIATAIKYGNAVVAMPATDSIRRLSGGTSKALDRSQIAIVQTPQIFRPFELKLAYRRAAEENQTFTDDASVYERYIAPVHISRGDSANVKLTYPEDFARFTPSDFRVGTGWDTHALVENRPLILGGVKIEHDKGLLGHSDADVLTHAVMDALLSAAHLRDIGVLFPDTDPQYAGISSMTLLDNVLQQLHAQGWKIRNVSAVILAQRPRLSGVIPAIARNLANAMGLAEQNVSVSATTTEKLGMVGHEEGISAQAYVAIYRDGSLA